MDRNRGFSLIELIIILVLIGILAGIGTVNFNSWQRKYAIEAQVKEMLSDISNVRMLAIQSKKEHRIFLNRNSYTVVRYADELDTPRVDPLAAGGQVVNDKGQVIVPRTRGTKQLKFDIVQYTAGATANFNNTPIIIDERGYTNSLMTIAVSFNVGEPAYNCLRISNARVNIGRTNAITNNCDFQ
jgi:prepilin-type N-terminal cleavage/methylation domain-containing protein